jgi:hypothetical protein
MPFEPNFVDAIVIGLGATLLMDTWNLFLKKAFGIPSLNYCLLGRWVRHMPRTFKHPSISSAAPKTNECMTGWVAHYSIGAALASAFVLLTGDWTAQPTLLPALGYGLITVVFPFFVLQPALGLGVASSKAAKPLQSRLKSLATHIVFGLGLYILARAATL